MPLLKSVKIFLNSKENFLVELDHRKVAFVTVQDIEGFDFLTPLRDEFGGLLNHGDRYSFSLFQSLLLIR